MNVNSIFPSRYLKAEDLDNQALTAVIENATPEDFGDSQEIVLSLKDFPKRVVLNRTNTMNLAGAFGSEMEDVTRRGAFLDIKEGGTDT